VVSWDESNKDPVDILVPKSLAQDISLFHHLSLDMIPNRGSREVRN